MDLPGWDTPEAVRAMHSLLEQLALLFFVLLVAFEIVVHWFGEGHGPSWTVLGGKIGLPSFKDEIQAKRLCETLVLVTFAIAIGFEVVAYWYGERNDEFSDETTHTLEQHVASSLKEAMTAARDASAANTTARGFEAQIADAKARAAEANKIAEDERSERVKIQARVSWRTLNDAQKSEIATSIRSNPMLSGAVVSIFCNAGDAEAAWFAADIAEALKAAKILRVSTPGSVMVMTETGDFTNPIVRERVGVTIDSSSNPLSGVLAATVARELNVRGFDAVVNPSGIKNASNRISIMVDGRPQSPQGEFKLAEAANLAEAKNKQKTTSPK